MARPQKKEADKLMAVLPPIRCTHAEKARFKQQAHSMGKSVSEYVRGLLDRPAKPDALALSNDNGETILDPQLVFQLRSIGNNINQAVRKFHIHDDMPDELRECSAVLNQLLTTIFKQLNLE